MPSLSIFTFFTFQTNLLYFSPNLLTRVNTAHFNFISTNRTLYFLPPKNLVTDRIPTLLATNAPKVTLYQLGIVERASKPSATSFLPHSPQKHKISGTEKSIEKNSSRQECFMLFTASISQSISPVSCFFFISALTFAL